MKALFNRETGVFAFPSKLDSGFCDEVISLASSSFKEATIIDDTDCEKVASGWRKSEVYWTTEQWIVDAIWPFMEVANELSGQMFDIERVEDIQITKYGVGGFYGFHTDSYSSHFFKDSHGKVRKLSMTVQLNDDYEGGEFQVGRCYKGKLQIETLEKAKGTVIVFPSSLEHQVKKVTSGERYSLVAWFKGPPLR